MAWIYRYPIHSPGPGGYRIFITRFNGATGAVTGIDSVGSPSGSYNVPTSMASDKYGNFYVGGNFATTLTFAGATLTNIGGDTDFFVAKYGSDNSNAPISLAIASGMNKEEERITVYPNPATDELNINGVSQVTNYTIYSVTGTVMRRGALQAGDNRVALRQLTPAVYIIELTGTNGARKIIRMIKE